MATTDRQHSKNNQLIPTREAEVDLIKGAWDTSSIPDHVKEKAPIQDRAGTSVADILNEVKDNTQKEEHNIPPAEKLNE